MKSYTEDKQIKNMTKRVMFLSGYALLFKVFRSHRGSHGS